MFAKRFQSKWKIDTVWIVRHLVCDWWMWKTGIFTLFVMMTSGLINALNILKSFSEWCSGWRDSESWNREDDGLVVYVTLVRLEKERKLYNVCNRWLFSSNLGPVHDNMTDTLNITQPYSWVTSLSHGVNEEVTGGHEIQSSGAQFCCEYVIVARSMPIHT